MVNSSKPPIIDVPHLLSRSRRRNEAAFTAIMWSLYAYLWTPLISLLAWWAGLDIAYESMVEDGGWQGLLFVLRWYIVSITLIFIIIAAWSSSNRRRFRNKERRQSIPPVSDQELMFHFGVASGELDMMRRASVMSINLDETGNINSISAASTSEVRKTEISQSVPETGSVN
jgi:biofilm PGA synthesis protein PgaD